MSVNVQEAFVINLADIIRERGVRDNGRGMPFQNYANISISMTTTGYTEQHPLVPKDDARQYMLLANIARKKASVHVLNLG